MADYKHKMPVEVYWTNTAGKTNSQYFSNVKEAEDAIQLAIKHNTEMGYLTVDPGYKIRDRVPITRKGAGRRKE